MVQPINGPVRVFVAIPLSTACRAALGSAVSGLRSEGGGTGIRWVPRENFHVTLKFLGGIEPREIERLRRTLEALAAQSSAFEMECCGAGVFPSIKRPRVFWVGIVEPTGALEALAAQIRDACVEYGDSCEDLPFRAHLTVARLRSARSTRGLQAMLERAQALGPIACPVGTIELLRSDLGPGGSVYTPLDSFPLNPGKENEC